MTEQKQAFTISPDVLYQQMGDEVVLLHLGSSHYYGLDAAGARFWQVLEAQGDPEAAVPVLLAEFDVDEATLRSDLQRLLDELQQANILLAAQ